MLKLRLSSSHLASLCPLFAVRSGRRISRISRTQPPFAQSPQTGVSTWSHRSDRPSKQTQVLDDEGVPNDYLTFFVTCHPGLEQVVAQELASPRIGASAITTGKAGVQFRAANLGIGFKANLWLRAAIRVLVLLAEGPLDPGQRGGDSLYDFVRKAGRWSELLPQEGTFSVEAIVHDCTDLKTNLLAATRVKDAVCDELRDRRGVKPLPPGRDGATLPLYLTAYRDDVRLYRDMSGSSLHRRGYRQAMHRASLNESAAAGLLMLAGWPEAARDQGMVLADPMCGSGTLLIEAALMATNVAPGLSRKRWPFQEWPDFDRKLWKQCTAEAEAAKRPWRGRILGNDIHPGAISLARKDAEAAGVDRLVHLHCGDCQGWQPERTPGMVITNPPWGARLLAASSVRPRRDSEEGEGDSRRRGTRIDAGGEDTSPELQEAWHSLGTFLKAQCSGATAYVLSGSTGGTTRQLRMRTSRKWPITIGGVDARLLRYEVNYPPVRGTGNQEEGSTLVTEPAPSRGTLQAAGARPARVNKWSVEAQG